MQRGFIQIPILIAIVTGILVLSSGGYLGVKQYQNYQLKKTIKKTETQALAKAQKEIQKLKEDVGTAQKKQSTLEQEIRIQKQTKKPIEVQTLNTLPPDPISQTLTSEEVYSTVSPSVVLIIASKANGSGFIINDGKYTVTNAHVVGNDETVQIRLQDGTLFNGVILGKDDSKDLALIFNIIVAFGSQKPQAIKLGSSDTSSLKIGSDVFALGFPLSISEGLSAVTFTKGTLSARQNVNFYSGGTLLQMDVAINHGNSGGPLVNNRGEVVGVNTFTLNNEAQGISFAIPIQKLIDLIPQLSQYGQSRYELYPIGSTLTIKRSLLIPIGFNNASCEYLGFKNEDLTICNLFQNYHDDYNWNIKEDVPGFPSYTPQ